MKAMKGIEFSIEVKPIWNDVINKLSKITGEVSLILVRKTMVAYSYV